MGWSPADYVVFGALVGGVCVACRLAARRLAGRSYRLALAFAVAAAFLLVRANGAVGIIGNERNDANAMFLGVLGIAAVGTAMARLGPRGIARTLYATALAQVVVASIALVGDLGSGGPVWPWDLLGITGLFATLWLLTGRPFAVAARTSGPGETPSRR